MASNLPIPPSVGNGNDYSGTDNTGTPIGYAHGSFSSVSGITSATDNKTSNCGISCSDYFSLQVNSNFLPTSFDSSCPGYSGYNGYRWGYQCWEQFLFRANYISPAEISIWYVLVGYAANHGGCVSTSGRALNNPPNYDYPGWFAYKGTCYVETSYLQNFPWSESAANLAHLSLSGSSAFGGSANDEVVVCDTTKSPQCLSSSNQDSVFNLYQQWQTAEFNIFGYGSGSQAVLRGSSTSGSLAIDLNEETDSGTVIQPNCNPVGYTGETNSLSLNQYSCYNLLNGDMTFTESGYYLTMTSNGYGTVSPLSGYYGGNGYYGSGTVKITATANSGYYFSSWTGSCSTGCSGYYTSTNNPATVTMNGPITEYATFNRCCAPVP